MVWIAGGCDVIKFFMKKNFGSYLPWHFWERIGTIPKTYYIRTLLCLIHPLLPTALHVLAVLARRMSERFTPPLHRMSRMSYACCEAKRNMTDHVEGRREGERSRLDSMDGGTEKL